LKRIYYLLAGKEITAKEALVVSLHVKGNRGKQVSDVLGKSYNTVIHQLQSVYDKVGVHDTEALVALAIKNGFDKKGCYKRKDLFVGLC
jgi:DNA-binding CsgD family transcriptional regulator